MLAFSDTATGRSVVPLEGLWSHWKVCGPSGRSVVPLEGLWSHWKVCGTTGRSVVPLEGLWSHWKVCGPTGRSVVPLEAIYVLKAEEAHLNVLLQSLGPQWGLLLHKRYSRDQELFVGAPPPKGLLQSGVQRACADVVGREHRDNLLHSLNQGLCGGGEALALSDQLGVLCESLQVIALCSEVLWSAGKTSESLLYSIRLRRLPAQLQCTLKGVLNCRTTKGTRYCN